MHPHSDGFLRAEVLLEPEPVFPLVLDACEDCGQVQINYVVDPAYLYGSDYLYDSSVTETGKRHFLQMAEEIVDRFALPQGALVVDIGSNVGLLLSGFKGRGMKVLGVDPAPKPAAIAEANGIETKQELFSERVAQRIVEEKGKASVLTATNVFAHIDDLDDFMRAADTLLTPDGILVIEAPYWVDLLAKLEYDTVYHQHLSYLAISPLQRFFARFGMELFDVVRTSIHGGSIRIFVSRKGAHPCLPIVEDLVQTEQRNGIFSREHLDAFAGNVREHRIALTRLIMQLKDEGKRVVGLSAPAKGNTLLNYCGFNSFVLDFITEKNPMKVGLFTPGTRIPVVTDGELLSQQPDYALILAWNFGEEIMRNQSTFKERGGKFILPIPSPKIL